MKDAHRRIVYRRAGNLYLHHGKSLMQIQINEDKKILKEAERIEKEKLKEHEDYDSEYKFYHITLKVQDDFNYEYQAIPISFEWLPRLGFDSERDIGYCITEYRHSLGASVVQETYDGGHGIGVANKYTFIGHPSIQMEIEYVHEIQEIFYDLFKTEMCHLDEIEYSPKGYYVCPEDLDHDRLPF